MRVQAGRAGLTASSLILHWGKKISALPTSDGITDLARQLRSAALTLKKSPAVHQEKAHRKTRITCVGRMVVCPRVSDWDSQVLGWSSKMIKHFENIFIQKEREFPYFPETRNALLSLKYIFKCYAFIILQKYQNYSLFLIIVYSLVWETISIEN